MDTISSRTPLNILFVGSGVGDHFWALHVNRYSEALREMGHTVMSEAWSRLHAMNVPVALAFRGYDVVMLQDTHLALRHALELRNNNKKTILLTHSEQIQGERDKNYIIELRPHYVFTDSPSGVEIFEPLGFPVKWMGHGADHSCYRLEDKYINVLWVGNRYAARDELVQSQVKSLMGHVRGVLMHGDGYMHGSVVPSVMFDLMARSKVVIHIGHPVTYTGGYSGTRISDALASGCYVVSTKYPRAHERYPLGAAFVDGKGIGAAVRVVLDDWHGHYDQLAYEGYLFVRKYRMARNDMDMVLESLYG